MTNPTIIGVVLFVIVCAAIIVEIGRLRTRPRARRASIVRSRRQHLLEQTMATSTFEGPRSVYGDCIDSFSIFRSSDEVRMNVETRGTWAQIGRFARYRIVRHLWRGLEQLTGATVIVLVDQGKPGSIRWSKAETMRFQDDGRPDPWVTSPGSVGTMISGTPAAPPAAARR